MNSSISNHNNDSELNSSPSKTDTRFGTDRQELTEEQLLADEDLWRVSSCDSDEAEFYNAKERNKDYQEDPEQMQSESYDMAKYLIEKAPNLISNADVNYDDVIKKPRQTDKQKVIKKHNVIKSLVELSILRCVRPDIMEESYEQLIENVIDTKFEQKYDMAKVNARVNYLESKSSLNHTIAARKETDSMMSSARGNDCKKFTTSQNNIQYVIQQAFNESDKSTPIMFLITHSVNVQQQLAEFHKNTSSISKLLHFTLGKGLEKRVEAQINKSAYSGDWLLLENLHLAQDWLCELEEILSKQDKSEINKRFRLFLSTATVNDFPKRILRNSIKIALQQPTGIKQKMERMFNDFEKQNLFSKTAVGNKNFHKNLYFALCYFHSILDGRKQFGTLGWNIDCAFDASDFDISTLQLQTFMQKQITDKAPILFIIKYLIANINYAGKVQRQEDMRKMLAILEDLYNGEFSNAKRKEPQLHKSHYGLPEENADYLEFVSQLPDHDQVQIFGFDQIIHITQSKKKMFQLLSRINYINKSSIFGSEVDLEKLVEQRMEDYISKVLLFKHEVILPDLNKDKKAFVPAHEKYSIQQPTTVHDSITQFMIRIQNILLASTLDQRLKQKSERYDEQIDSKYLPKRDASDRQIEIVAQLLRNKLRNSIQLETIKKYFPITYKDPVRNCYNRELLCFKSLLNQMQYSVEDLLEHSQGQHSDPLSVEKMWSLIQSNLLPKSWGRYAFQTAYTSLADFLIELEDKLQFWDILIESYKQDQKINLIWLPAFYDVTTLFNTLIQNKCRAEEVSTREIINEFEIMNFYDKIPEDIKLDNPFEIYVYGFWLQGAKWDAEQDLLVENNSEIMFQKFPVVKLSTNIKRSKKKKIDIETESMASQPADIVDDFSIDNPQLTKKERRTMRARKRKVKNGQELSEEDEKIYSYKCPVFRTTLRLLKGMFSQDNSPVEYINLRTKIHPSVWIKRSVALLLETQR